MEKLRLDRAGGPKAVRDSNIELYRILMMLLIIAHHYVVNSGLDTKGGPIYADPLSAPSLFLLLFGAWGKMGLNCFVLVTGYYMCHGPEVCQDISGDRILQNGDRGGFLDNGLCRLHMAELSADRFYLRFP